MGGGYPQPEGGYPQNICSIAAGGRVVESRLGGGWVGAVDSGRRRLRRSAAVRLYGVA